MRPPPLCLGFAMVLGAALAAGMPARASGVVYQLPVAKVTATSAEDLARLFAARKYSLAGARRTGAAPRLYADRVPGDLARLPTAKMEPLFIGLLLPLVAKANGDILAQRERLIRIRDRGAHRRTLDGGDRAALQRLARLYSVKDENLDALLDRVDIIPASLAIAQGIDESGWGTAHLAKETNGLFGEHAHRGQRREVSAGGIAVAAFPNLLHGVYAYMHTLNTGAAYTMLRRLRAEARAAGQPPNGTVMAIGLKVYSQRGRDYVKSIHRLIERHRLTAYDMVSLAPRGGATLISVTR